MVELSVLGDRSVEDPLREVIGTDVPTDGDGVPPESFNFLDDKLSFLFIEAADSNVSMGLRDGQNGADVLAHHNLCTILGKDDSDAPSNSLQKRTHRFTRKKLSEEASMNLGSTQRTSHNKPPGATH